jgi:hypothetical protein
MANGTIERKCMKGHKKGKGSCSSRCMRWYPRIQLVTPDAHSRRKFNYLGGYPTRPRRDQHSTRRSGAMATPPWTSQARQTPLLVGQHTPRSTTCWTTGSPTSEPTRQSGCEPSAATANCSSITCAPTSAPSP